MRGDYGLEKNIRRNWTRCFYFLLAVPIFSSNSFNGNDAFVSGRFSDSLQPQALLVSQGAIWIYFSSSFFAVIRFVQCFVRSNSDFIGRRFKFFTCYLFLLVPCWRRRVALIMSGPFMQLSRLQMIACNQCIIGINYLNNTELIALHIPIYSQKGTLLNLAPPPR